MGTAPPDSGGGGEQAQLRLYADAIAMWQRRFDTQAIALTLGIPEPLAARWVANFRDVVRQEPMAQT